MKIELWEKKDIASISNQEKEMWFNIYNNDLFEDRGYDVTHMKINEIDPLYKRLKKEYFDYLDGLQTDENFICYVILKDDDLAIVSQARLVKDEIGYLIEGLETHRDLYKKGFGKMVIGAIIDCAKKQQITELYARISPDNKPSIITFEKSGFTILKEESKNRIVVKKSLL